MTGDPSQFAARRGPARLAAWSAVVLVHLLLAMGWIADRRIAVETPMAQAPLRVVLIAEAPRVPPPPDSARPTATAPARTRTTAPSLTWVPPEAAARAPAAPTITAEPAPAAASAPPLNLALPRAASPPWRAIDAARAQLQSASQPGRVEASIGRLTQNDGETIREESLGDGRTRLRGHGGCVEVHQARITQLDPFNKSVQPAMAGVTACRGDPPPRRP